MLRTRHVFHRSQPMQAISEINVTSLLDMCFCLLIIFMISTPLIDASAGTTNSVKINLPNGEKIGESQEDKTSTPQNVSMDSVGRFSWGDKTFDDKVAFEKFLSKFDRDPNPPVLNIKIDKDSPYQDAMTLMTLLGSHNLTKFSLDYRTE
jgi:biopolymer transport protein ExbD